jgi:uncharacterized protein
MFGSEFILGLAKPQCRLARTKMTLKDQITEDMKTAMRAKDAERLGTIRLLLAAIKQKEVDERIVVDDAQVLSLIEKMLKQRKDSITAFLLAKRDDLVAKEKSEVLVLQAYMPAQMSEQEVTAVLDSCIAEVAVSTGNKVTPAEMGKVMALLKPKLAGKADMSRVSQMLKAKLAS